MKKVVLPMVLGVSCWLNQAEADIVCLRNGNFIEGVVVRDTESDLELEVFFGAKITFNKQDIAYVKTWSGQDNHALREKWLSDRKEREQAERTRQEFEAQQREKGLIKYKGEWIPESEKEQLQTREYIEQVLKSKIDGGEIAASHQKGTDIARGLLARRSWRKRQTEHFMIYYEDLVQSKMVADRAEYFYEKIAYDLDYEKTIYWPDKCAVFIIPNREKWQEYMEEFVQSFDHIGGFVPRTGEREIYLCALSLPYLTVTFPHELTHLILKEFSQGRAIPLWLNEGLAIYESGLIGYADQLLRDKVREAQHISLKKMLKMSDYPKTKQELELYYAQAEKIVEFFITQHGRKRFSHFCQLLTAGNSFAKALDLVYGDKYYSQNEFQRAWIKYVLK